MDAASKSEDLVSVYELVNETRKEVYLATITRVDENEPLPEIAQPPTVAHWDSNDEVYQRVVAYTMPLKNANGFIKAYATSWQLKGWRVLA